MLGTGLENYTENRPKFLIPSEMLYFDLSSVSAFAVFEVYIFV
jgi:hypothetical protein